MFTPLFNTKFQNGGKQKRNAIHEKYSSLFTNLPGKQLVLNSNTLNTSWLQLYKSSFAPFPIL